MTMFSVNELSLYLLKTRILTEALVQCGEGTLTLLNEKIQSVSKFTERLIVVRRYIEVILYGTENASHLIQFYLLNR